MKRPLIGLALSAVGLVLSLGLCGMSHGSSDGMVYAGLIVLAASLIGGLVCFIWLVVVLIRGNG